MSQPQALHSILPAGTGTPQRGHFVSCGSSWRRKRGTSLISHLTTGPLLTVRIAVSRAMGTDPHSRRRSESTPIGHHGYVSLLWRIFLGNAAVLVIATLALVISPATVSFPIATTEAVVLTVGLAVMLAVNYLLLR